jgi:hypothetical protein
MRTNSRTLSVLTQFGAFLCYGILRFMPVPGSSLVGLLLASYLYNLGDRGMKLSAEELLKRDSRRPVLLLRPFRLDELRIRRHPLLLVAQVLTSPVSLKTAAVSALLLLSMAMDAKLFVLGMVSFLILVASYDAIRVIPGLGFEEALVNLLSRIGPVVTMGHPDPASPLEPLGAARTYAADAWREEVIAMARRSALVVIIPDTTKALRWELDTIAKEPGLQRVVIVLPPDGDGSNEWRMPRWYRQWRQLRNNHEFLPRVDDSIAAVWFGEAGEGRSIKADSANVRHQLVALEAGLAQMPGLQAYWHASRKLEWRGFIDSLFVLLWLAPFGLLAVGRVERESGFVADLVLVVAAIVFWSLRRHLPGARSAKIGIGIDALRTANPERQLTLKLLIVAAGSAALFLFSLSTEIR